MLWTLNIKTGSVQMLKAPWKPLRLSQAPVRAIHGMIDRRIRGRSPRRMILRCQCRDLSQHAPCSTGLFSIPELKEPADFPRLAQQAIGICNSIRTDIASVVANTSSTSSTNPSEVLSQLDDISKHVCNVIDAAELCRSVHADESWRDAAQVAFQTLSDYMGHLNADRNLYEALQLVTEKPERLTDEDRTFAKLLQAEFERDGIHLDDTGRQKVQDINADIGQLEGRFQQNLYHSKENVQIINTISLFRLMDRSALETSYGARITSEAIELPAKESNILQTIYKYSPDPALRKEAYMGYASSLKENINLLAQLRSLRHELAITQGFQSFAHRTLTDRMANTPETVNEFLQHAISSNRPQFHKDMTEISSAKKAVEGTNDPLEAWDMSFYTHLLQARASEDVHTKMSAYLTLPKALETLKNIMNRLFGISMTEETIPLAERWDQSSSDSFTRLQKFAFSHPSQGRLGTLYLDLHPRAGKYAHAAHYTVRCGCQWSKDELPSSSSSNGEYQLPIVALVCSLSSNDGIMSHSELETLFHEMGHAVHSLLSRTKYQHVSGTRAAMDFVETPSQFLEQFAWDGEILREAFGVSDDCIRALTQSRTTLSSVDTQNQLLYSLFDQQLFGAEHRDKDSSMLFQQLHLQLQIPYANGSHWYTRFGHLITYGAGYYGYLYSKGFAMELYRHVLEQGNGISIWKKLLVYGGSKDPMAMLTDVFGRPPSV